MKKSILALAALMMVGGVAQANDPAASGQPSGAQTAPATAPAGDTGAAPTGDVAKKDSKKKKKTDDKSAEKTGEKK